MGLHAKARVAAQGMMAHALWYAGKGLSVVPLCWPVWKPRRRSWVCGCGRCEGPGDVGKRLLLEPGAGAEAATEAQIARWWSQWPDANIGICLEPSGLLVVDLDGYEARLEAQEEGLYLTRVAASGRGLHYYYKRPPECPIIREVGWGLSGKIDLLTGGYVVAPPSRHRKGARYQWRLHTPAIAPPEWIRKALCRPSSRESGPRPEALETSSEPPGDPALEAEALWSEEELWEALGWLPSSEREIWLQVGMALHQWDRQGKGRGRGRLLWDRWSQWGCEDTYDPHQQDRVWGSFRLDERWHVGTLFALAYEYQSRPLASERAPSSWDLQLQWGAQCPEPLEHPTPLEHPAPSLQPEPPPLEPMEPRRWGRVALLDREHHSREQLALYLQTKGYEVTAFGCPHAIAFQLQKGHVDAVVWECLWPPQPEARDEEAEAIAALQSQPRIWVLFAPPDRVEEVRQRFGPRIGDCLAKSQPYSELGYRAHLALAALELLEVGPLQLDRRSKDIALWGKKLDLTPRERDLLALLMGRAGELLGFEQIVEAMYPNEQLNWKENLRQHICRLRRKFEAAGGQRSWIANSRGVGYILELREAEGAAKGRAL